MKITITLEVPDGTGVCVGNDSEYLSHEKNSDNQEIKTLKQSAEHYKAVNEHLSKMIAEMERKTAKEIERVFPLDKPIPSQKYHCPACGEFSAESLTARYKCSQCGNMCDLMSAPRDDFSTIPCLECGVVFDKSKGGKYGTCPNCTSVRCPTCKQPSPLSEMEGPKCKTCRGG